MRKELATALRIVARIAANQHGVVSFEQLVGAGFSPTTIHGRTRAGHLHRLYRGVYAVGRTNLSENGRFKAAVLACGPGAVLSHESAAKLWSLSPASPPSVHVTVPTHAGEAKRMVIVIHRSGTLRPEDTTLRHDIPVTTRTRTLADLGWDAEPTRSHLEREFLKLVTRAGLPKPEVNARLGPYLVDFLWRESRLVVETDGLPTTAHERRSSLTAAAIASSPAAASSYFGSPTGR